MSMLDAYEWFVTEFYPRNTESTWAVLLGGPFAISALFSIL